MNAIIVPLETSSSPVSAERILVRVAMHRGCRSREDIRTFLDPQPALENPLRSSPATDAAMSILSRAFSAREHVLIFGDWDCDGICSTAIVYDILRSAGFTVECHLPVRRVDEYGLTDHAAEQIIERGFVGTIIAVDCGSNAASAVSRLVNNRCNVIILDHHSLAAGSVADTKPHINPKLETTRGSAATDLCASGLCFFFAEIVAERFAARWNRERALLYAGLATLVDVVPLTRTNRALVKRSLTLINNPVVRSSCPGIAALLLDENLTRNISSWTYGFHLGPILNAGGRIDDARRGLSLLLAESPEQAAPLAAQCIAINEARKDEQQRIHVEAIERAERLLSDKPDTRIIVLGDPSWHCGVVGIVASHIRERFFRPAILFGGYSRDRTIWKGSGRSIPGYDLGRAVSDAVSEGMAVSGGGHPMAAGITLRYEDLDQFTDWINRQCSLPEEAFAPMFETIPAQPQMVERDWTELFAALEPFGASNPKPHVIVDCATLLEPTRFLHARAHAGVGCPSKEFPNSPFAALYRFRDMATNAEYEAKGYDIHRARALVQTSANDTRFRILLSLRRSSAPENGRPGGQTILYRWIVDYIEAIGT